mmetsp:Transcript_36642/g.80149  ORF Transcript_36642/g.80149 Transcript_36642/m.80149 type:complete len:371 (-) Transcript_36642:63-1175(-)|eukprot:CAMPEP_0178687330 /NCGR_PEP_ID=MMETSP0699-20121125/4398_1 /TAXON_ID=265572 /ORGANISM="Extubocellulus spinifer, Strain CCMP396" /LENGTH=370 /DNA_ID=CAMNT_0020332221 /DNA_START=9 /DNA_END=1121 /DNA_ORIENTATION=-
MFRKPKSKKKSAFRKPGGGGGMADGPSSTGGGGGSKFRKRSNSSSSDEDGNDDGTASGTSDLLEQLRREKQQQQQQRGGKKRRIGSGAASDDEGGSAAAAAGGGGGGVMHEFQATDDRLTEKEMATRTAEHHPTAITQGSEKTDEGGPTAAVTAAADPAAADGAAGDDRVYKGQNAGQSRNKFLAGPLKAPTFVRTTCRFDYQPDICKDYKDTGFCGFGDSCIYLHDRGDTLTGWQLEAQYEERKKAEREAKEKEMDRFLARASGELAGGGNDDDDDDDDDTRAALASDGLPFACHICRNPFTDPVVTNCSHYFCQKCIMDQVRQESAACPICGKDTGGVFNHPNKLVSKKRRLVGSGGTWQEFADAARK